MTTFSQVSPTAVSDTPARTQTRRFNRAVGQSPRLQQGQHLPGDGGWHYPGAEEGQSQPGVRWVCKLKRCVWDCSFLLFKTLHFPGIFIDGIKATSSLALMKCSESHFNLREHHKLELIKQTSGTSLGDGVIMASNGPSNLQHICSWNNWIIYHFATDCFCIITRFDSEFPSPQFVIRWWATRALWWAVMRIPSFPAHLWNTQTHSERRGYCVIITEMYQTKRTRWQRIDCGWMRVWFLQRHEERQPLVCLFQYVPENLLPVYREKIVPLSDILTPNQFEAEWVQPPVWVQPSGAGNACMAMVEKRASR